MTIPHLKKTLLALGLIAGGALTTSYVSEYGSQKAAGVSKTTLISTAKADARTEDIMGVHPLGDQYLGKDDAPVVMVEYASLTCGHCGDFHKNIYPQIKKELIDTGKVKFIFRDFPLDNTAFAISAIARCIAKDVGNDKFFPIINELFYRQSKWMRSKEPKRDIVNITKLAGYNEAKVDACLTREPITKGIKEVQDHASEKLGVRGTPTLFINGKKYEDGGGFEGIKKKVLSLIKE